MSDQLRDFSRNLPMALLRAREAVMTRFRPILREHGLTEQQWRVVRALHGTEGLEPTELAARTLLHLPSLTRILRDLEARGLVERTAVEGDNRRRCVELSDGGVELFSRMSPLSEAEYRDMEGRMGQDTLTRLHTLLDELAATTPTDN